jgi:hypothetical protein
LGPIDDLTYNPHNHQQIALKLKAKNGCNVLYVIWRVTGGSILVSNKRNDGYKNQCGPTGYTAIAPAFSKPVPELTIGSNHTLQAEYVDEILHVYADGALVWQHMIGRDLVPYDGPVGLRTDGAAFKFDVYTKLHSPLASSNYNVASVGDYQCLRAKPSIQYPQSKYILERNRIISPVIAPTNYAGKITSCTITPDLPPGLTLDQETCAISGAPTTMQSSVNYSVTAINEMGSYNKSIWIRVMTLPQFTYSQENYTLTTTAKSRIVPAYRGNAVEACTSDKALPRGLTLSDTCEILGKANEAYPKISYRITGGNLLGAHSELVDIEVIAPPELVYSAQSYKFKYGESVKVFLRNNHGAGSPPTSCAIDKTPPSGISFNPATCGFSGHANAVKSSKIYTITGTNKAGSHSVNLRITIDP